MSLDIYVYSRKKRDSKEYILTISGKNSSYATDYISSKGLEDLAKWIGLQENMGKNYKGNIAVKNYDPFVRLDRLKYGSPLTGNEKRKFRKGLSKRSLIDWIDKTPDC